ncbi:hypothetical protein [Streptomyces sp. NPDC088725]|uniref:hypothetical protein n=1 Tax=Streptomyces sp. NPDC088725 TaxID=3365873 RepID=UPI00382F96D2
MIREIVRGAVAGAAGTTALNAMTYGDMAVRGRPTSSVPEQMVEKVAAGLGHPVRGGGWRRDARLTGLGALGGLAVGTGAGAAMSLARWAGVRMPVWLGGVVTGALVMATTDLSMARLKVSDPRTWSASDWLSDAVPHLVYGLVTYGIVVAADGARA